MSYLDEQTRTLHLYLGYVGGPVSGKQESVQRLGERLGALDRAAATRNHREDSLDDRRLTWSLKVTGDLPPMRGWNVKAHVESFAPDGFLEHGLAERDRELFESYAMWVAQRDAIVFVADARSDRFELSLDRWSELRAIAARRTSPLVPELPIVVQLTKLDHPLALRFETLAPRYDSALRVCAANALTGEGVLETAKVALMKALGNVRR